MSGKTDEIGDPVVTSILPDGPKVFPRDLLAHGIDTLRKIELPEEELAVRQLPSGGYAVESPFGFRHDTRNESEGMFIVYAHRRGVRTLNLPEKMIDIFRAVKGYKGYLQTLWRDLYKAYGRRWGEAAAAYKYAKAAFDAYGLGIRPERGSGNCPSR